MISEADIADALGQRLEAMTGVYPIIWENQDIKSWPERPYLVVEMVPTSILNQKVSGEEEIHRGFMQVTIVGDQDKWARPNERHADLIRAHFKKGTKIDITGGKITIKQPPFAAQGFPDDTSWRKPVQIFYEAS